jgi:hypothetical protein
MKKLLCVLLSFSLWGASSSVGSAMPPAKVFAGVQTSVQRGDPPKIESVSVLPPGTAVRVRLQESLNTKRNRAGDRFSATLDGPLLVNGRVAVPRGTRFEGRVVRSSESGRFKGRAALALRLDSFRLNGVTYDVNTSRPLSVSAGHKKRNWLWIAGGSGAGAAIGAVAGGGAGALIGAGAGAAAGAVGAAVTGKRHVSLPVESRVTFTLQSTVAVGT